MCGIGGTIGVESGAAHRIAAALADHMGHRGPDDADVVAVPGPAGLPPVVLAHRRLAIIDLSPGGHQPMQRGAAWLAFNGEVYNYREAVAGARNDTEAILETYRAAGPAGIERLRGMFAWCLVDAPAGRVWLCRDRLGIKPLYLQRLPAGGLVFSSELRALLAATAPHAAHPPRREALASYFAYGAVWSEGAITADISLLPPATSLLLDFAGREADRRRYWDLGAAFAAPVGAPGAPIGYADAAAAVGERLRRSVREHLLSDVPLGLFLSGGIDSTAIACLAAENSARIRTLCIGFDRPEADESAAAAQIAKHLGTEHETIRLTGASVLADLDEALAACDQPSVDGFNTYFVSKAARAAGLTVALSGLGGDELFCGYPSFRDAPRAARWRPLLKVLRPLAGLDRRPWPPVSRAEAKLWEAVRRAPGLEEAYRLRRELCLPATLRALGLIHPAAAPAARSARASVPAGLDPLQAVSYLELSLYMRHMLLRDADVFSMARSLELRVPFLDHTLVELVAGLPSSVKDPARGAKRLLVDAVGPRFPVWVYGQPKRGFAFPWDAWLRGAVAPRAAAAARDRERWRRLGLSPDGPARLWDAFARGDRRVAAAEILALVVLHDFAARWRLEDAVGA